MPDKKMATEEIVAENYHDGIYNGLKFIGGIWEQTILR